MIATATQPNKTARPAIPDGGPKIECGVEAYVAYCEGCFARGRTPDVGPANAEQLKAALREFPDKRMHFAPADPKWLELLGIPAWYGKPIQPFDELWKERFLQTLIDDDDFRRACVAAFRGQK